MTEIAPAPMPLNAPPLDARYKELPYGGLFLIGMGVIFAIISPLMLGEQSRLDLTLGLLLGGAALLALGRVRQLPGATVAGTFVLWTEIAACVITQTSPMLVPAAQSWGPRGLLLLATWLGWLVFLGLPVWLMRGTLAVAAPTLLGLLLLWTTAPSSTVNAVFSWLAADSHGTVYATMQEGGAVWLWGAGGPKGILWPRRAVLGKQGPGFQPAGMGSELASVALRPTPAPGSLTDREFFFCGMAVDPHDNLWLADLELLRMMQFDPNGQIKAIWSLPSYYTAARGCLAADDQQVYLADSRGWISAFSHQGELQRKWETTDVSLGLAISGPGRLMILHRLNVEEIATDNGKVLRSWPLPAPTGDLQVPYQALTVRRNGEVLVTDLTNNQVRRFTADGQLLPPIGGPGGLPGQFNGLGGMTEGPDGQFYVADVLNRAIHRFRPDNTVEGVWTTPTTLENE